MTPKARRPRKGRPGQRYRVARGKGSRLELELRGYERGLRALPRRHLRARVRVLWLEGGRARLQTGGRVR